MEKLSKMIFILLLGIFTAAVLLLSTEDVSWMRDEIFAIFVSIIFFSPVINAFFDMKLPYEWIMVFIVGGILFVVYSLYFYSSLFEWVTMIFRVVLFSSISSTGGWLVGKIEDKLPPNPPKFT